MFDFWYFLCRRILVFLPSNSFNSIVRIIHFIRFGIKFYPLRKKERKSFTSFLWEIKPELNEEIYRILADKMLVKDYLNERAIPDLNIIPNVLETDKASLLSKLDGSKDLIVKANHGSGWNYIIRGKQEIDTRELIKLGNKWLSYNAYYLNREPHYKGIKPMLIVEELIDKNLTDFKFFCYKGVVKIIQVDEDRFTNHKRSMFNRNWVELEISYRYDGVKMIDVSKHTLQKMVKIAETLSREFRFVRIDLYQVKGQIYFGEYTFCPGGGNEPFIDFESDEELLRVLQE